MIHKEASVLNFIASNSNPKWNRVECTRSIWGFGEIGLFCRVFGCSCLISCHFYYLWFCFLSLFFFFFFFCEGGSFGLIELVENEGRGRSERDFSCKLETRYTVGETKGTRGSNWKWYLVTTFQQPCPNNVPFSTMVPLFVYACRGCLETSVTLIKW